MHIATHHKPSTGMPGPEEPARRGWLGVVTGIRLIQISTGGFLVVINYRKITITHHRGSSALWKLI